MDEKKYRELQTKHARFQSGIATANAFNLKTVKKGIERLQASTEQNMAINKELLESAKENEKVQKEIAELNKNALSEEKKQTELAEKSLELEKARYDAERLEREKEKADKKALLEQKNLVFAMFEAIDEISESKSTQLEKFFFFRQSEELLSDIETDDFEEFADKEFINKARKKAASAKEEAELNFSAIDKEDAANVVLIDKVDENKKLNSLLKKCEALGERFDAFLELHSVANSRAEFGLKQESIASLKKTLGM